MISVDDIRKLAVLARIKLSEEEEKKLAEDMENILGYVEQIQQVSSSLEASEKGTQEKVRNFFRDDSNPHESGIHTEVILNEAPQRQGQYVKVKKIL